MAREERQQARERREERRDERDRHKEEREVAREERQQAQERGDLSIDQHESGHDNFSPIHIKSQSQSTVFTVPIEFSISMINWERSRAMLLALASRKDTGYVSMGTKRRMRAENGICLLFDISPGKSSRNPLPQRSANSNHGLPQLCQLFTRFKSLFQF